MAERSIALIASELTVCDGMSVPSLLFMKRLNLTVDDSDVTEGGPQLTAALINIRLIGRYRFKLKDYSIEPLEVEQPGMLLVDYPLQIARSDATSPWFLSMP